MPHPALRRQWRPKQAPKPAESPAAQQLFLPGTGQKFILLRRGTAPGTLAPAGGRVGAGEVGDFQGRRLIPPDSPEKPGAFRPQYAPGGRTALRPEHLPGAVQFPPRLSFGGGGGALRVYGRPGGCRAHRRGGGGQRPHRLQDRNRGGEDHPLAANHGPAHRLSGAGGRTARDLHR